MRVAYVCTDPGVPPFGCKGASVHVQAVTRELLRRGHDVHLITTAPVGTPPADLQRVRTHRLPVRAADDAAAREVSLQAADAQVKRVLAILHGRAPLDLVYERYSLWGRAAMTWSRANRVRSVLEVNAPLVEEQARHRGLVDHATAEDVAGQALTAAGRVACVSEPVAAWARRRTTRPVHVVPNGVDTRRVRPPSTPVVSATGTTFTVGFVGTLKPWHGVDLLCEAFGRLAAADPTYRLLIVGDGPLAEEVRRRASARPLAGRVEMTGSVDPAEIPLVLHRMDVGTAPYPSLGDFYFSPLKVFEYLAAGVPVVASRIGALPDLLAGGRLGTLVTPGDPASLAAAVDALRADPVRRQRLRHEGRSHVVQRHDWSLVVDTLLDLAMSPTSPEAASGTARVQEGPHAVTW